jgi:hypothetical protein
MDRALGALLILIGGLSAMGWMPGGWWATAVAGVVFCCLSGVVLWARHAAYIEFSVQDVVPATTPAPLQPHDKIAVRATGRFEVEGRRQFFLDLQAYFRTFATRERAVFAIVPPSRFLGIGTWPPHELGMWYYFFLPKHVLGVRPGMIVTRHGPRPALRVTCQSLKKAEDLYLTFESDEDRQRVWQDILYDLQLKAT